MQRPMRLRCTIAPVPGTEYLRCHSVQFDGTPFSLDVRPHQCQPSQPFDVDGTAVPGYVGVVQEGQQDVRAAITLPTASIQFGHQVTVHEDQLTPLGVTIKDFVKQH